MRLSDFDRGRIGALSDGVFAIAMTLLVLDLRLPDLGAGVAGGEIAQLVMAQGPRLLSWLLSFAILCRLWIIQYGLLTEGASRSRTFVGWCFVFLGAVSFLPFPTSLLAEHYDQAISVWIFSATLTCAGYALAQMWVAGSDSEARRGARRAAYVIFACAVGSSLLALYRPVLGAVLWLVFPFAAVAWGRRRHGGHGARADSPPDL